ncbi:hypothetical protein D3Z51_02665 [Clostridiaceae bacterium]|nr:hypothetical protein [Clostridiaceae bacterium]RKI18410.1 hypothetical protein D7V81_00795 [bacterium 1XD21-70]
MVRKICPVCDQVMKYPHYCQNCGSWVRHPRIQEVSYYLNERHPEKEAACSYHGNTMSAGDRPPQKPEGITRPAQAKPPTPSRPAAIPSGMQRPAASNSSAKAGSSANANSLGNAGSSANANSSANAGNSGSTAGWVRQGSPVQPSQGITAASTGSAYSPSFAGATYKNKIVPFVAIMVASSLVVFVILVVVARMLLGYDTNSGGHYESFLGADSDEYNMDYDYYGSGADTVQELSDEDVIKAGKKCSENGHFGISGTEMEEFARQALEEYGYGFEEGQVSRTSYNTEYLDYDGEIASTDYSTYVTIWVKEAAGGEDHEEYVEICYDTATGQLHGIELRLEDREMLVSLSCKMLEQLEKHGGFTGGGWPDSVRRDMPKVLDTSNGYSLQAGNLSIMGYGYEGIYWFNASLTKELEDT